MSGIIGIRKPRACLICGKPTYARIADRPICDTHSNVEIQSHYAASPRKPGDSAVRIIQLPYSKRR